MTNTRTADVTAETVGTDAFRDRLDTVKAHAVSCGRLDCGHLGKSASLAVRRAVILYTAEGSGLSVSLDGETPEVVAVLGVLRTAQHARPTYVRGTLTSGNRGYVAAHPGAVIAWPNADGIKITPQRAEVFGYMVRGYSATDISSDPARMVGGHPAPRVGLTVRNIETVKSHAGYLRRETGAHDAVSALLALVAAGKIADPAIAPLAD